ncbi:MAG: DUF3592 domain-containing protein, partial [Cyclobacteriaceae bacterium]|nr:DUF3592 domain-containing protein [Cyclobacteriaceae bacterium]
MSEAEIKAKILELLGQNKRFQAIKYVRHAKKISLKEATAFVESIGKEHFPNAFGKSVDPGKIVGWLFSGFGLVFFIVIAIMFWSDRKSAQNSTHITGKVTSLDYSHDNMAAPVISYRHNGKKHFTKGTTYSNPPSFEIGEEVDLIINNNNPNDVIIDSFFERYFLM